MTNTATPITTAAEQFLSTRHSRVKAATKYLAVFASHTGKHIALTRQTKDAVYVWLEQGPTAMDGIAIKNRARPGLSYSADQPRNSNLKDASCRLGIGNRAFYIKCETLIAFERLIEWYDKL
jgi:hypothetical protein